MNDTLWYLTRSTGIVATVLAVVAVGSGLLFSARETGTRRRPNWWLDLHNWLGGLALVFTAVHLLTAYLDDDLGLHIVDVFVPGVADSDAWAIGWGVLAFYLLAIAVFTTWPRRRFARPVWRAIHLGSVAGTALAMLHAYQMGTDAARLAFKGGLIVATALGTYTVGVRLFGLREPKSQGTLS